MSPAPRWSRGSPVRLLTRPELPAGLLGSLLLPLAAAHGGYRPTAWGLTALLLLWGVALALILRADLRVRALELALLSAVTALFAWILCSNLWTASPTRTMLDAQRVAVYVAGVGAVLLLVRVTSYRALLAAAWCAITLACVYALATRLFPERLGVVNVIAGYRLSEPLGYWNALGVLAAMAALLALGFAAHGGGRIIRAAAAASLPIVVVALYFTFSRGAWGALACGLLASLLLDRRRLGAVTALLTVGFWPGLGVWIASRSEALTREGATVQAASEAGHHLALILVGLALAAALSTLALGLLAAHVQLGRRTRMVYAATLLVVATALVVGLFVRYGSPVSLAERGYRAFTAPPPVTGGDLNRRLFTISSIPRAQQWTVAWHDYRSHPWLGSGAGTYERQWLQERTTPTKVIDAHSLYLETLGELGPLGLLLLLAVLGVPVAASPRARRHPLAPAAFGAYLAYVAHAGVDWDWEMPAVTLTALFCGGALVVCARDEGRGTPMSVGMRGGLLAVTLAIGAFAFAGLVANHALSESTEAAREADHELTLGHTRRAVARFDAAEADARRALDLAPWSTEPWVALAHAQLLRLDPAGAAESFRKAIAKEPDDWSLWYGLARATRGRAQRAALRRAAELNPLSPEVAGLREQLRAS